MPEKVQKTGVSLEFVRTFCPTAVKLRTRKPNIHAVVAVSAVVAVKNTKGRKKVCDWAGFWGLSRLPWVALCICLAWHPGLCQSEANCLCRLGDVPPVSGKIPPFVPPRTPGFRHTSAHVRALVKATFHREKEKGRKLVEATGLICGARGRNRTGTPCGGGF